MQVTYAAQITCIQMRRESTSWIFIWWKWARKIMVPAVGRCTNTHHCTKHQITKSKTQYIHLVEHTRPKAQNNILFDCLSDAKASGFLSIISMKLDAYKTICTSNCLLHVIYLVFDRKGPQAHNNRPFQLYYSKIIHTI